MAAPSAQDLSNLTTALNNLENSLRRNNNIIPRRNPAPTPGGSGGSHPSHADARARQKELIKTIRRLEAFQRTSYSRVHAQNIKNARLELQSIQESNKARDRERRLAEHRANADDLAHAKRVKNEERIGYILDGVQDGLYRFFGRPSIVEGVDGFIKDFSAMLGAGVEWSFEQYVQSAKLGIKQQDLVKMQQQYSHLYVSMSQANNRGIDFADAVKRGSDQLDAYTSTNEEAANLAASNLDFARSFGLSIKDSANFADKLNKQFSVMNTHIKVTAEEFQNLTSSLQAEGEMKDWMLRLSESEREAHISSSVALYQHFRTLGKTNESAQNLTMRFNEMFVKKKSKDYLKETVKMQAAMGAMGMGDQAQEYYKLREKVFFGKGSEKEQEANKKQLADMMGRIGKRASDLYTDYGAGAVIDKLDEKTEGQISEFRGFTGEMQKANGFLEKMLEELKKMSLKGDITTFFAESYKFLGATSTWFHDSPGEIVGGVVKGIIGILGIKALLNSLPKVGGVLSGLTSKLWNLAKVATLPGIAITLTTTALWMWYKNWEDITGGLKLLIQDISRAALSAVVGTKDGIINALHSMQDKYNSWVKAWQDFSFTDSLSSIISPFNTLEDYFTNSTVATYFDSFVNTLFNFDERIADWFDNTTVGKIAKAVFNTPNTSEAVTSYGFQNENILPYTQPQTTSKEVITKTVNKQEAKDEKIVKVNNESNTLSQEVIKLLIEQNKMNQESLSFQKKIADTNEKMSKPGNSWFQRVSYDNVT